MLIGYSQPAISGAVGITGATWLTADGGAALFDGRPSRRARLQWGAGTPALGQYVAITATFAAATPLRILALLGSTLPVGCRVDFLGAGGDGLGGFCDDARTVRMPDGTVGVWGVARADDPAETGIEVRIYNDANGVTWASSGTVVDIGEVISMPGVSVPIRDGWAVQTTDPSEVSRTRGGQVNTAKMSAYRTLTAEFAGMSAAKARGAGLEGSLDLDALAAALRGSERCAVIPHYRNLSTKALDATVANRSAIYGYAAQIPDIANISRGWFAGQIVVEEIPAG